MQIYAVASPGGDVLQEGNLVPTKWPLVCVVNTYPEKDGIVNAKKTVVVHTSVQIQILHCYSLSRTNFSKLMNFVAVIKDHPVLAGGMFIGCCITYVHYVIFVNAKLESTITIMRNGMLKSTCIMSLNPPASERTLTSCLPPHHPYDDDDIFLCPHCTTKKVCHELNLLSFSCDVKRGRGVKS